MTVVPVNVEALKKAEKEESQARWKTEKGWIYPGMKSTLECNEHPQRPNTARIEELQEVRDREIDCNCVKDLIKIFVIFTHLYALEDIIYFDQPLECNMFI